MTSWTLSIPTWGVRCTGSFLLVGLPAIKAALGDRRAKFVVHTDNWSAVEQALSGYELVIKPVPPGRTVHQQAGAANREAIQLSPPGSRIAFINADMVPSIEVFDAADRRFNEGKRVVMMAATRTIGDLPPVGATSRNLLAWTMRHKHSTVAECFWGRGRSSIPWAIYFENGNNVVLHGFHLHPFAIVKSHAQLTFSGVSIDTDLMDQFPQDEVHVVTDADEAAFAEMSPPERVFRLTNQPFGTDQIAYWASANTTPLQRWMFAKQIVIAGSNTDEPLAICDDVIRKLAVYETPPEPWRNRYVQQQRR